MVTDGSLALPSREVFARGRRRVEVVGPGLEDEVLGLHRELW